jgi:hypothetical protein
VYASAKSTLKDAENVFADVGIDSLWYIPAQAGSLCLVGLMLNINVFTGKWPTLYRVFIVTGEVVLFIAYSRYHQIDIATWSTTYGILQILISASSVTSTDGHFVKVVCVSFLSLMIGVGVLIIGNEYFTCLFLVASVALKVLTGCVASSVVLSSEGQTLYLLMTYIQVAAMVSEVAANVRVGVSFYGFINVTLSGALMPSPDWFLGYSAVKITALKMLLSTDESVLALFPSSFFAIRFYELIVFILRMLFVFSLNAVVAPDRFNIGKYNKVPGYTGARMLFRYFLRTVTFGGLMNTNVSQSVVLSIYMFIAIARDVACNVDFALVLAILVCLDAVFNDPSTADFFITTSRSSSGAKKEAAQRHAEVIENSKGAKDKKVKILKKDSNTVLQDTDEKVKKKSKKVTKEAFSSMCADHVWQQDMAISVESLIATAEDQYETAFTREDMTNINSCEEHFVSVFSGGTGRVSIMNPCTLQTVLHVFDIDKSPRTLAHFSIRFRGLTLTPSSVFLHNRVNYRGHKDAIVDLVFDGEPFVFSGKHRYIENWDGADDFPVAIVMSTPRGWSIWSGATCSEPVMITYSFKTIPSESGAAIYAKIEGRVVRIGRHCFKDEDQRQNLAIPVWISPERVAFEERGEVTPEMLRVTPSDADFLNRISQRYQEALEKGDLRSQEKYSYQIQSYRAFIGTRAIVSVDEGPKAICSPSFSEETDKNFVVDEPTQLASTPNEDDVLVSTQNLKKEKIKTRVKLGRMIGFLEGNNAFSWRNLDSLVDRIVAGLCSSNTRLKFSNHVEAVRDKLRAEALTPERELGNIKTPERKDAKAAVLKKLLESCSDTCDADAIPREIAKDAKTLDKRSSNIKIPVRKNNIGAISKDVKVGIKGKEKTPSKRLGNIKTPVGKDVSCQNHAAEFTCIAAVKDAGIEKVATVSPESSALHQEPIDAADGEDIRPLKVSINMCNFKGVSRTPEREESADASIREPD